MDDQDLPYLRRCVELAAEGTGGRRRAVSVPCWWARRVRCWPRTTTGWPPGPHPPPGVRAGRWSAAHLSPEPRAAATVYTSGEHCPMCAAAHAWVGLGRIVTSPRPNNWPLGSAVGGPAPPVRTLPVNEVAPGVTVEGPVPELVEDVHALHRRFHSRG